MDTPSPESHDMAKAQKTTPVRLTDEAVKWGRIASGYTGESMSEYVSRIVVERGKEDAERLHAAATGDGPKNGKSAKRTESKGE